MASRYAYVSGVITSISMLRARVSDLPKSAQAYVRRIEEVIGSEIILVSVGPGREQTILLKNPFDT
jgi:adenylosuccinate synthase